MCLCVMKVFGGDDMNAARAVFEGILIKWWFKDSNLEGD